MKKILFMATVATTLGLNAQKVDLDRFNFTFEYRNLPHNPLDETYKTYAVLVDVSGNVANAMSADIIANRIELQGFERTESNGDVRMDVRVDDLMIDKYQVVETSTTTKNKDGSETKNYSYYVSVDYTIGGSASFTGKSGIELSRPLSLFSSKSFNWASASYKTRSEASSYYSNNKLAIINKLVRERMEEALSSVNYRLNYDFGFPVTNVNWAMWLLDSKKHPEHEPMSQRWAALKPVIQAITANSLTEETKSKMLVMIAYFDEIKTKYATDEKADKKIRYAAFYNNALLYLMLDMPDKAGAEANGLIANDFDSKDGEKLAKDAEELIALFGLNKMSSRHFVK